MSLHRLVPFLAVLALLVGACGSHSTTSTTAPPSSTLTTSEKREINRNLDTFDRAVSRHDALTAAGTASGEALTLSVFAAQHPGTPLAARLIAASRAWVGLSRAILSGNQQAVTVADNRVQTADQML